MVNAFILYSIIVRNCYARLMLQEIFLLVTIFRDVFVFQSFLIVSGVAVLPSTWQTHGVY